VRLTNLASVKNDTSGFFVSAEDPFTLHHSAEVMEGVAGQMVRTHQDISIALKLARLKARRHSGYLGIDR